MFINKESISERIAIFIKSKMLTKYFFYDSLGSYVIELSSVIISRVFFFWPIAFHSSMLTITPSRFKYQDKLKSVSCSVIGTRTIETYIVFKIYFTPKIEEITHSRTGTRKCNWNISTVTAIFLNQKRANVCEHMTKMASLEFMKGATRGLREEWMEGNLKEIIWG